MGYNQKFFSRIIALIIFLFIMPFSVFSYASAINADYLTSESWQENQTAKSINLNKTSLDNTLNGIFKYFVDSNANTVYLYFNISESSLTPENHISKINFTLNNAQYEYSFSVDKNGICDYFGEEDELFEVEHNFEALNNYDIYMVGIHINNGSLVNKLSIKLNTNGHNYSIAKNILIDARIETTVKQTTTKPTKTTTKKQTTTKTATLKPTKYIPNYNKKYIASPINPTTATSANSTTASANNDISTTKLEHTQKNKTIQIASYILIGTGVIIVISSIFLKKRT